MSKRYVHRRRMEEKDRRCYKEKRDEYVNEYVPCGS